MQIVIDIPKEMYERIKEGYVPLGINKHLKNGTPLPKRHGKIIDSNEFNHYLISRDSSFKALIAKIPAIIEAN